MIILGLDMSSTCIGYALADGADYGHRDLTGDIAARCSAAAAYIAALLDRHAPALIVIESPVARFAKAVIPQARVSGAVLAVLAQRSALWVEVTPSAAKQVLAGDGAATKDEMIVAAAKRLRIDGDIVTIKGKRALVDVAPLLTEDEADAYALALCGAAMRIMRVA